jgi:hypothetical protein
VEVDGGNNKSVAERLDVRRVAVCGLTAVLCHVVYLLGASSSALIILRSCGRRVQDGGVVEFRFNL